MHRTSLTASFCIFFWMIKLREKKQNTTHLWKKKNRNTSISTTRAHILLLHVALPVTKKLMCHPKAHVPTLNRGLPHTENFATSQLQIQMINTRGSPSHPPRAAETQRKPFPWTSKGKCTQHNCKERKLRREEKIEGEGGEGKTNNKTITQRGKKVWTQEHSPPPLHHEFSHKHISTPYKGTRNPLQKNQSINQYRPKVTLRGGFPPPHPPLFFRFFFFVICALQNKHIQPYKMPLLYTNQAKNRLETSLPHDGSLIQFAAKSFPPPPPPFPTLYFNIYKTQKVGGEGEPRVGKEKRKGVCWGGTKAPKQAGTRGGRGHARLTSGSPKPKTPLAQAAKGEGGREGREGGKAC